MNSGVKIILSIMGLLLCNAAIAQCNISGDELVNRIDMEIIPKAVQVIESTPDPGKEASLAAVNTAVQELGQICVCNLPQATYVSVSLSQTNILRSLIDCKYFSSPSLPPSEIQSCISDINASLIKVRNIKSAFAPQVRAATCAAVDPVPPGTIPMVQQEVSDTVDRVAEVLSERSRTTLIRILKRGRHITFNPQASGTVEVSLHAVQILNRGKVLVPVASGTAVSVQTMPVDVTLVLSHRGIREIRSNRTKRLRLTITFTPDDGAPFSSARSFRIRRAR